MPRVHCFLPKPARHVANLQMQLSSQCVILITTQQIKDRTAALTSVFLPPFQLVSEISL